MQCLISLRGKSSVWYKPNLEVDLTDKVVVPIIWLAFYAAIGNLEYIDRKQDVVSVEMFEEVVMSEGFDQLVQSIRSGNILQLVKEYTIPLYYIFDVNTKLYSYVTTHPEEGKFGSSFLEFLYDQPTKFPNDDDWPSNYRKQKFVSFSDEQFPVFPIYMRNVNGKLEFSANRTFDYLSEQAVNKMVEYHLLRKANLKLKKRVLINKSFAERFGSQITSSKDKSATKSFGLTR